MAREREREKDKKERSLVLLLLLVFRLFKLLLENKVFNTVAHWIYLTP